MYLDEIYSASQSEEELVKLVPQQAITQHDPHEVLKLYHQVMLQPE